MSHTFGQFSIADPPHTRLALDERLVQALLRNETLHLTTMRLDKIETSVPRKKIGELFVTFNRKIGL